MNFDESYFQGKNSGYIKGYLLDTPLRRFFENQIRIIKKFAPLKKTVCEIGCAYGFFLKLCDMEGWNTFGSDISAHALETASRFTKATLVQNDIQERSPFPNLKADVVACFDVIEHLSRPKAALIHMRSLLRRKGILIMTTPNPKSYGYRRILFGMVDKDTSHISVKSPFEWISILESVDLKVISLKTETYLNPLASISNAIYWPVSKILSSLYYGAKSEIRAIVK